MVLPVVSAQRLSGLHLGADLARLVAVVGHLALDKFPEQRAVGEHVDLLVVLALLEQLGRHIARRTRELHRTRSQVGLQNEFQE